ncbi:MAG: hypothetical protein M9928_07260 [Anaerolineae bacterium]|nr:hypothetical protein [Anaerolineae bacterium]MCO5197250.1 hypothetical protein [Anaerolineae bacterium]MCO5204812.1 hypothetical protein [Anaerolineae bacterium]
MNFFNTAIDRCALMLAVIIALTLLLGCDSRGSSESDGVAALTTVTVASPQETAIPSATPGGLTSGPLPTATAPIPPPTVPATPTATSSALVLPEPLPGWQWRERDEPFLYAFMLPHSWESVTESSQQFYRSTETTTRIFVEIVPRWRVGEDHWESWLYDNQQQVLLTSDLSRTEIHANAMIAGHPAYLHVDQSPGNYLATIIAPTGGRLLRLRLHNPEQEPEKQIFRTMAETMVLSNEPAETGSLPPDWEINLEFSKWPAPYAYAEGDETELQEIVGQIAVVELAFNGTVEQFTLVDDNGAVYTIIRPPFSVFLGTSTLSPTPLRNDALAEGARVQIVGRPTTTGEIVADYIVPLGDGQLQRALQTYFDLRENAPEPALLTYYVEGEPVDLWLRGTANQLLPYLLDEQGNAIDKELLPGNADEALLAGGVLQNVDPPRIVLSRLYALHGQCRVDEEQVERCQYYQPVLPPVTPTRTITATVQSAVVEMNTIILEQPVEGFVTIALKEGRQLLATDNTPLDLADLAPGTQITATGVMGEAGALLAEFVRVVSAD